MAYPIIGATNAQQRQLAANIIEGLQSTLLNGTGNVDINEVLIDIVCALGCINGAGLNESTNNLYPGTQYQTDVPLGHWTFQTRQR